MIIDAHAHIFDQICGRSRSGPTRGAGYGRLRRGDDEVIQLLPPLTRDTSFPADVLVALMDWQSVDRAVLLQGDFYGGVNEAVAQAVENYPDRLRGAAYIDPLSPDHRDVLHKCVEEHGFRTVKLEMSEDAGLTGLYPDLRLDDPGMDWLWREADARRLVVTLDLGSIGTRSYQTREVRTILDRYPRIRIVIAHLAHPPLWDRGDSYLDREWRGQLMLGRMPNVWFDLAALPIYAPDEDYPYPTVRDYIRVAVEEIGAGSLMWGTDVPGLLSYATYEQLREMVARHCDFLSEGELAQVMGLNALRVYWEDRDGGEAPVGAVR